MARAFALAALLLAPGCYEPSALGGGDGGAPDARSDANVCGVPDTIVGESLRVQGTVWDDLSETISPPLAAVHVQSVVAGVAAGFDDTDGGGLWAIDVASGGHPVSVALELTLTGYPPHLKYASQPMWMAPSTANAWMKGPGELAQVYGATVMDVGAGTVFLTVIDCGRSFVAAGGAEIPGAGEIRLGRVTSQDWYSAYGLNVAPGTIPAR